MWQVLQLTVLFRPSLVRSSFAPRTAYRRALGTLSRHFTPLLPLNGPGRRYMFIFSPRL
jgi:hypothetical protein